MSEKVDLISEYEKDRLAIQFAKSRGDKGFTPKEYARLLSFVNLYKFQVAAIELVSKGLLEIDLDKDGLVFKKP